MAPAAAAPSLFIVGAGRAGSAIARAVQAAGGVVHLHGRLDGVMPLGLRGMGAVLVAVRDAQLDAALNEVREALGGARPVVLHASGSAEPHAFTALRAMGVACGTLHPLVPLADTRRAPALLRDAWFGIDGDAAARDASTAIAALLGAHVVEIPAGEKARYHAAAVIASNFPTVLAALAERLMQDAGIAPNAARGAVRHLLSAAAANLADADASAVLTGPIVRGDAGTVRLHLDALANDPRALAVYGALGDAALTLARDAGTPPDGLDAVARELSSIRACP